MTNNWKYGLMLLSLSGVAACANLAVVDKDGGIPQEGDDGIRLCDLGGTATSGGRISNGLHVHIKNIGSRSAGPSDVKVIYDMRDLPDIERTQSLPGLAPGRQHTAIFFFPEEAAGCWSPDCFFTIVADPDGTAGETNTENNSATGYCPG